MATVEYVVAASNLGREEGFRDAFLLHLSTES
jgi:hypothetical protein